MQCNMRQHFADRYWLHEHPGGRASWREPTMRKFTKESTTYFVKGLVCKWNVQKMRSESSEDVRRTTGFFTNSWRIIIALERYFEEHAQEVWERNWMNPEMQITFLNTYPPRLIATILWDDVNGWRLPEDLVLAARREEIDRVHSEGFYEIVRCKHETVGPDLGGHRQVCGSSMQENSIETLCRRIQNDAMPPLEAVKVLVSIMMSVSVSNKRETIEVETLRHQQSTFPRNSPETHLHQTFRRRSVKSMCGTQDASHIWQLDYVNLICWELGGSRRGKHSAALFHNPNLGVRVAVHGDDFVCFQTMMDSNTSTVFSNPHTQRKSWEHLDSKIQT